MSGPAASAQTLLPAGVRPSCQLAPQLQSMLWPLGRRAANGADNLPGNAGAGLRRQHQTEHDTVHTAGGRGGAGAA